MRESLFSIHRERVLKGLQGHALDAERQQAHQTIRGCRGGQLGADGIGDHTKAGEQVLQKRHADSLTVSFTFALGSTLFDELLSGGHSCGVHGLRMELLGSLNDGVRIVFCVESVE